KENYSLTKAKVEEFQAQLEELRKPYLQRIEEIEKEFARETEEVAQELLKLETEKQALDAELRASAILNYQNTGKKTLDENLSVRVSKSFDYDIKDAVKWAELNAPILIEKSIDKDKFKEFAEDLDFVTVHETVTSVIKGL